MKIETDKGTRNFKTTEAAVEWLLEVGPEEVAINGADVTCECDWTEYGVALGVLDYALVKEEEGEE